jgi:hypothetical protein
MKTLKPSVKKSEKPIFEIKFSRIQMIGFVLLSCILIVALFNMQYGLYALPVVLFYIARNRLFVGTLETDGQWTINGQGGYELLPSSIIRRYLIVLYFKPRKMVAIFPDSMGHDDFRRLRATTRHLLLIDQKSRDQY